MTVIFPSRVNLLNCQISTNLISTIRSQGFPHKTHGLRGLSMCQTAVSSKSSLIENKKPDKGLVSKETVAVCFGGELKYKDLVFLI